VDAGSKGADNLDQIVSIGCTATDDVSGVASTTCEPIRRPAHLFPMGLNTVATTAVDNAGHHAEGSVMFRVIVTPEALAALVDRWVTHRGVAATLRGRLRRGNVTGFIALVTREIETSIAPQHAAELIRLVGEL
jgi:hypothetical protein